VRRVLVVDDSAFMRRVLRDLIDAVPGFVTCGAVRDAEAARAAILEQEPDLVTLDVELPGVDGLAVLEWIMREAPRPVVMVSGAATTLGVDTVLRALELGAVEFVRKPSGPISLDLATVAEALARALQGAAASRVSARSSASVLSRTARTSPGTAPRETVVAIAASTGGPAALSTVLAALPATLEAAVVIVQHMPVGFTRPFADRLARVAPLPVREAGEHERVVPGTVWLAPAGWHLAVERAADGALTARRSDAPPRVGVRPSADVLFESVASAVGAGAIGVVLTGMGEDGAAGLRAIHHVGGQCLAQDAASAVVDGMPAAARRTVPCDAVVTLEEMAHAIVTAVHRARGARYAA
jgi:two-component system chemotaxis response regulator CheB